MNTVRLSANTKIRVDAASAAQSAAAWLVDCGTRAYVDHNEFFCAVSGGNTARDLFRCLGSFPLRDYVEWDHWKIFFVDERAVPFDSPDSNYRWAEELWFANVRLNKKHIFRMPVDNSDLSKAAETYEHLLKKQLPEVEGHLPRFDAIMLGLGEEGHTGSIFPGSKAESEKRKLVAVGEAPSPPKERLTLTLPTINAAANVAFLVTGEAKQNALQQTLLGKTPAAAVHPKDGELWWFLDEALAGVPPDPVGT